MYKSLLKPIVVAMEVMSPVARYLTFIVGADLLSKFQCNETAVSARVVLRGRILPQCKRLNVRAKA